jgi:hypothetical protein
MSMLSNLDLIRRVPLFPDADADAGAVRIADGVVKRRFRARRTRRRAGQEVDALFILLHRPGPRARRSDTRRPRGHPGGAASRATTSAR